MAGHQAFLKLSREITSPEQQLVYSGVEDLPLKSQALTKTDLRLQVSVSCQLDKETTILNDINLISLYLPKSITILLSPHATGSEYHCSISLVSKRASKWSNYLNGW